MPVEITLYQIFILSILASAGVLGSKFGVITQTSKDFLARIIFNITLPSMLLTNFSRIEITPRLLTNSLAVLMLAAFVLLFMLFAGYLGSRILKLERSDAGIYRLHSMLGNIIYLGFPVISALYGEEGLLYASIFTLVSNILMWTVGVMTISDGKNSTLRQNISRIVNPNTIAILTGFILFISSVKLPKFVLDSIGGLGGTNSYLSMIYIGSVLFFADVKELIGKKNVWVLTASRLLVVPMLLLLLFILAVTVAGLKIDTLVASVLILQASMPCMVNVVIMVNILGGNDRIATANVFLSTLLSLFTLPLMLLMLRFLR
jgi:predicted permease